MPGTTLPNLDHVFSKWENRGPADRGKGKMKDNGLDQVLEQGRQKWKAKFGDTKQQPMVRRRTREKRNVVLQDIVQLNTIAQFKKMPTIVPDQFVISRPLMGQTCNCMPNSQKDLISTVISSEGMRDILDVRHELRGSGLLSKQFAQLVYAWRRRTIHKYPEVSLAVMTSQRLLDVINAEILSEEVRQDQLKIERRAKHILKNMKSSVSNALTRFTGWFLHHFLGFMLSGIHVHRGQMKMVHTAAQRGLPMLYLPLHRSHLDYILITFVLWNYDIRNPQIAAGNNLNIFIFSWLIRGLGGFFIRRKLDRGAKKDNIYRAVLHTYVEQLLMKGESLEFFLEGGRSRTGKALHPKGGLLSVVVDCLSKGVVEDVYVVPISISYEKILDGNYQREQMGEAKKKETFIGAMRAIFSVFRGFYGSVRVDFGQPFSLRECIAACQPPPQSPESPPSSDTSEPSSSPLVGSQMYMQRAGSTNSLYGTDVVVEGERKLVSRIGYHVVHSCVEMSAMMCTNLVAFLLLTKHRQGTRLDYLVGDFQWLQEELRYRKRDLGFSPMSIPEEVVNYALSLLGPGLIQKTLEHSEAGETKRITPVTSMPCVFELNYYSNPVVSVFLLDSIVVNAVIYLSDIQLSQLEQSTQGEVILMSREEVLEIALKLCALLKFEFIFVRPCCCLEEKLADTLDQLVTAELLRVEDSQHVDTNTNVYDKQWASRLSASLSWAEEGEEEEFQCSEQLLRVNLDYVDCREKLQFHHSILAPYFESYLVTAHHISDIITTEMAEEDFIKKIHTIAKDRVLDGAALYGESAALEILKNSVKAFKDLRIIDSYVAGNLCMLELHGRYDVKEKLAEIQHMLESLRG